MTVPGTDRAYWFRDNHWFLLLQWKYAMKAEAMGLRHSSRRSVRAHAARMLRTPAAKVPEVIDQLLAEYREVYCVKAGRDRK